MRASLVTLSYSTQLGGFDTGPLDALVETGEALSLREYFFEIDGRPHLTFVVLHADRRSIPRPVEPSTAPVAQPVARRPAPDPVGDLTPAQAKTFDQLRRWRSDKAKREGLPPYILMTNRELTEVARSEPRTLAALKGIRGIGDAKVQRHGREVLGVVEAVLAVDTGLAAHEGASDGPSDTGGADE